MEMTQWRKNVFYGLIMILWRMINVIRFKIIRTPSRIFTLILSLILLSLLWSDLFMEEREKYFKYEKKNHPKVHFRPIKRDSTVDENKGVSCPIYQLKSNNSKMDSTNDTVSAQCKRILPLPGSCETAKEIFDLYGPPNPAPCMPHERFDFCLLQHTESSHWTVLCDLNATHLCTSGLKLGLPSHETGELIWEVYNNSIGALEKRLTNLIQGIGSSHSHHHFGFAFIGCEMKKNENDSFYYQDYQDVSDSNVEQLLLLPPTINSSSEYDSHNPSYFNELNLNVILVDSLSYQHLFRSLPKTVSMLEQISASSSADVFNFELFQAVKSRTFETLQTMFSGYINVTEKPFGRYDVPGRPLDLTPIYKPFQKRRYRTLWLEDLCYLWEWGISKDLKFLKLKSPPEDTWRKMWLALDKNGVDSIDATIAMCRVLEANGVKDHFHGPDAVCFNGRHQHEYLLEYLKLYQTEMTSRKRPFFTMTSTNVAHEHSGKRVQTLDNALSNYTLYTASLENTISIIFSDHGNSYGKFVEKSKEAMIELYHPFMFFIIPYSAGALLGKKKIESLRLNTKRLITSLDVHYTLLHIANASSLSHHSKQQFKVSELGLFEPVDPQRDCYSVPRLKPNICICQSNKTIHLDSKSFGSLFGYLAVGVLNEEIQFQYQQSPELSTPSRAFGNCEPLQLEKVTEIKELAGPDGHRIFQMNIHVQQSQIFFVSVTLTRSKEGEPKTFLESYSRITPYGIYSNCSDPAVENSLCICNLSLITKNIKKLPQIAQYDRQINAIFTNVNPSLKSTFNYIVTPLKETPCFYIGTVSHKNGKAVFGMNECKVTYSAKIDIKSNDEFMYYINEEGSLVHPGGIAFFTLFVSESRELWSYLIYADVALTQY